jgi:hypothetical protein
MPDALTLTLSHGEREHSGAAFPPLPRGEGTVQSGLFLFLTGSRNSPGGIFPFLTGEWEQSGAAFPSFSTGEGIARSNFSPLGHRVRVLYSLSLWERAGVRASDRTFSKEKR